MSVCEKRTKKKKKNMTHLLFLESAVSGAVVDDGVVVDGVGGLVLGRNQPFSQRRRFRLVVWQRRCTHSLDRYLSFLFLFLFLFRCTNTSVLFSLLVHVH